MGKHKICLLNIKYENQFSIKQRFSSTVTQGVLINLLASLVSRCCMPVNVLINVNVLNRSSLRWAASLNAIKFSGQKISKVIRLKKNKIKNRPVSRSLSNKKNLKTKKMFLGKSKKKIKRNKRTKSHAMSIHLDTNLLVISIVT